MIFGRDNMQYFALCGRVDSTEGGGDMHIFIPKCKLMEGFGLTMEKGRYVTPEITAMAVYEGETYGMAKVIQHSTAQAVTIPILYLKALRMSGTNVRGGFIHPQYGQPDLNALGLGK